MKILRAEIYSEPHYRLMYGDDFLGMVEKVDDGYIVNGKRKPVPTLKEAAKQMLDKRMNKCLAEHDRYRKQLQAILST